MESNHSVANTFYEILVCELSRLVFSPSRRVTGKVKSVSQRTCLAKRSAQVSHVINAGFRVLAALLVGPRKPDIRCVTPGHPVDVNPADEVVLIRVISHRPYKSRCRCLGSRTTSS